tara:strand:+ start:372 stop:551 length:180 start_codon:yes stop_codon:yes gene_type:complete
LLAAAQGRLGMEVAAERVVCKPEQSRHQHKHIQWLSALVVRGVMVQPLDQMAHQVQLLE